MRFNLSGPQAVAPQLRTRVGQRGESGCCELVVVEELIPESERNPKHFDTVTMATGAGSAVMMILDVGPR